MAKYSKFIVQGEAPIVSFPCLENVMGRAESVLLQKLHYLLHHSTLCNIGAYKIERTARNKKKYLGVAYEAIVELMGMMSLSTVKRAVKRLRALGILVVEKLAKSVWIRLNFYRIDYHKLNEVLGLDFIQEDECSDESAKTDDLNQDIERKIKVAKEAKVIESKTENLPNGTDKPRCARVLNRELDSQTEAVRKLYMMLRGFRVDIDLSHALFKRAGQLDRQKIAQHILSVKSGYFANFWHTPEQLGLDKI